MTDTNEAARIIASHLEAAQLDNLGPTVVRKVHVLEASAGLTQLGAHAALVVELTNGERYGLEVCPFPQAPVLPTGRLRELAERADKGCTHPEDEPCFGRRTGSGGGGGPRD